MVKTLSSLPEGSIVLLPCYWHLFSTFRSSRVTEEVSTLFDARGQFETGPKRMQWTRCTHNKTVAISCLLSPLSVLCFFVFQGEAMGTTAPVIITVYPRDDGVMSRRLVVSLRIPTNYQVSPPVPIDSAIRIEDRPGMTVYSLWVSPCSLHLTLFFNSLQ